MRTETDGLLLSGPDAGNPLGFLAALGALRVATLAWPQRRVRMAWTRYGTGWRPWVHAEPALDEASLVEGVHHYCRYGMPDDGATAARERPAVAEAFPHFAFERDTNRIAPDRFSEIARSARSAASATQRVFADFLAALGCEACVNDDGFVSDTALRTMSGQGHQHFLATMLKLADVVEPRHIRASLFEPWRYADPMRGLSMRWDPRDDRRYALQWQDPEDDPNRGKRGSMLGANRLAVEALPLLPAMPVLRGGQAGLATTGFAMAREPYWTWPVWRDPVPLDVCASLLAHHLIQELGNRSEAGQKTQLIREQLRRIGVEEVFRSRRISVAYFRNLTPAVAV